MVKWTSGKSERTLNQNAANGRKEPNLTDAALGTNVGTDRQPADAVSQTLSRCDIVPKVKTPDWTITMR